MDHFSFTTLWSWISALSIVNWIVGFVTGWFPFLILIFAMGYWLMQLWQMVTGAKISDTRWAKKIQKWLKIHKVT